MTADWIGPLVVCLLAWILADLLVIPVLGLLAPSQNRDAIPTLIYMLVAAMIGWGMYETVFRGLYSVRVKRLER